ncbi:hypothetical protein FHE65_33950 [Mumia zhuanghuii]|uniref:Uncharacterized protein n=1 Tax=Mumia zhuanghuii TaxID=2585211 RepID=A0A5C4M8D9_9ACTN|nr:hypothetical protein FHE65_33950 [Mumia zhuanghuii]
MRRVGSDQGKVRKLRRLPTEQQPTRFLFKTRAERQQQPVGLTRLLPSGMPSKRPAVLASRLDERVELL